MALRSTSLAFALSSLSGALTLSSALQVTPNSPCASTCTSSLDFLASNTDLLRSQWKDIDCNAIDFENESRNHKMRDCMSCLQESTFADGTGRDNKWFLFLASLNAKCPRPQAVIVERIVERDANDAASSNSSLPAAGWASIIAGAIILCALAILGALTQFRKRKTGHRFGHGRNKSSLSFCCQAGVISPHRSGYYNEDAMYDDNRFFEKPNASTGIAVTTTSAVHGEHAINGPNSSRATQARIQPAAIKPSIITTNLPPPSPTYTSSRRMSSPDDYTSPSSSLPAFSYTPNSSNIGVAISPHSFASFNMTSPTSRDTSPSAYKPIWPSDTTTPIQQQDPWQEEKLFSPKRQYVNHKSRPRNNIGSPTQVTPLQLSFPPPPRR